MDSTQALVIVSEALRVGAKSVRGELCVLEIKRLSAKVLSANPTDIKSFAFLVGRNSVISRHRREQAAARKRVHDQVDAAEMLAVAKVQWEQAQDLAEARGQFDAFVRDIPEGPQTQTLFEQTQIVRLQVLDGRGGLALAEAFPGSTPAQRWQWKRRGLKLLLKHNPPEPLKCVLLRSVREF